MSPFAIFFIGALIFSLMKDFRRDRGDHQLAKGLHAASMVLFILLQYGSLNAAMALLTSFARVRDYYSQDIGILPGNLNFPIFVVGTILSVVALFVVFRMIKRQDQARRVFLWLLPGLAITNVFGFYRGWVVGMDDVELNFPPWIAIAMGAGVVGGFALGMFFLYRSTLMKDFFAPPPDNPFSSPEDPGSDQGFDFRP